VDVGSSGGTVSIDQTVPSSYPFTYNFDDDTSVAVEAVPDFGYVFDGWSGDLSGAANPTTLLIDCDKNITASFSLDRTLIGTAIGSLVLIGLLVSVLIIKRRER